MNKLFTLLFISISAACFSQQTVSTPKVESANNKQQSKPDTVVIIPELTQKRILSMQEQMKQIQQEIEAALRVSIEAKGISTESVQWDQTTINIPERKIFVKLKPEKKK